MTRAKLASLVFLSLQSVGILSTVLKGCPKDWKRFENSCFMSPSASFDWFSAQANCSQYNAHLATISSESENAFLIREIVSKYYQRHFWIGLKRSPFVYSVWAWVDGSPVSFTDWWPGQPDDYLSGEGCAEFYGYIGSNVHWNDLNCSKSVRFICEKVITVDLQPCSDHNGGCAHFCLSTIDGPKCKCKDGFISQEDGAVCLDPTKPTHPQTQRQAVHLFDVALLTLQLLSFILLIPMSCVLVSFYRRVSRQRRLSRLKAQHTVMINSQSSNDEHGLNNQTSEPLAVNPDSSNENDQDV